MKPAMDWQGSLKSSFRRVGFMLLWAIGVAIVCVWLESRTHSTLSSWIFLIAAAIVFVGLREWMENSK